MADQDLIFIHLADIHFNKHSGDSYDLDSDLRNEILEDIKRFRKTIDCPLAGILISGDIAYSGKKPEYDNAINFIQQLSSALDISETLVFCVPGNHDVDQEITKGNLLLDNAQQAILGPGDIDENLTLYLRNKYSAPAMLDHINEYNRFAAQFSIPLPIVKTENWRI